MKDERVVYGANCTWVGKINEVATTQSGLPCCPQCGGTLFEFQNEQEYFDGNERVSEQYNIDYHAAMEWVRSNGICNREKDIKISDIQEYGVPPIYSMYLRRDELA